MSGDGGDGDSNEACLLTTNDKGSGNKRKFLSDPKVEIPIDESASSLDEFHGTQALAVNELGSSARRPENVIKDEEEEEEEEENNNWEVPSAHQLEELLTDKLLEIFQSAIKRIVECGYSEVAACWAVLNSGLSRGSKDVVSNIVDASLDLLKTEKECNIPKKPVFDGLRSLVEYFVLEMTNVILEVKPELTITQAMWCLLVSDMNLSRACVVEKKRGGGSSGHQGIGERSEASGNSHSSNKKTGKESTLERRSSRHIAGPPLGPRSCTIRAGKKGSISIDKVKEQLILARDHVRASAPAAFENEKLGHGKKWEAKKDKSRQKGLQLEKGHIWQDALKAKVSEWGNMVLEKSLKSQSNLLMKIADVKSSKTATALPLKEPVRAPPEAKSEPPQDPRLKAKTQVPEPAKDTYYYDGIPYDEALQKHIPRDEQEKNILVLVSYKQKLEKDLQHWSDWANEKVMQAAKKLARDQVELKRLRQEKEEEEKSNKEKQSMEDSANKRILEMEAALSKATSQIEMSSTHICRLQEENSLLKKKMGVANMRATDSYVYVQEAILREQEAIRKSQLLDTEKGLCLDHQAGAKREVAVLNDRLERMRERQDQLQVLLMQDEKEKLTALAKYNFLKSTREEDEALAIAEAENMQQMAEMSAQKTRADIKNLENMISELRLKSERLKATSVSIDYDSCSSSSESFNTFHELQFPNATRRLPIVHDNLGSASAKSVRECIMCMTEEISEVFLPCAHQVLCVKCSILHERQGMNDCPSCRAMIQARIGVKYREF